MKRKNLPVIILATAAVAALSTLTLLPDQPGEAPGGPTHTATIPAGETPCFFNWATQDLPELSSQVQQRLDTAGMEDVSIRVEAYGENCIDPLTNAVRYFAALETDFHFAVEVDDLADLETLGGRLGALLLILDDFPTGATPGPQAGYVGVTFSDGADSVRLWFQVTEWEAARATGLQGAALYEHLSNP
ncbi:MAG: hypothetical protein FJZ96_00790 [Chloroflexi bacterium]|nr:hypothetical protein [Chloroflexota bacterium]